MLDLIERMAAALSNGGIVLYPTDTVWAIGCDATNAEAVARIRSLRDWPDDQGLVVIVPSIEKLKDVVGYCNPRIETVLAYHRRPLTVVYDQMRGLAHNVGAADGSVAVRVVHNAFLTELFKLFDKPLVATLPVRPNEPYPVHFGEISSDFLQAADFVVVAQNNKEDNPEPSVMIQLDQNDEIVYLRH